MLGQRLDTCSQLTLRVAGAGNDEDGRCYIEGYGERKCYHHGNVNPYEPEPHRTCK